MSSLEDKEEIEMIKQFHIKVQVKKKKVDALFDTSLQTNLVVKDLMNMVGLQVHDHPFLYQWDMKKKDVEMRVTN